MSTVLAYTSPAIGHLFPMVPLLLELRGRGHEVHVRTLDSHVDMLHGLGLHAEPIDPGIEAIEPSDYRVRGARQSLASAVRTFTARAALDGPDLDRALADVSADAVIVDINAWGALLSAETWGGPWVTFSPYTPPIRSAGTPPFGPGLLPRPDLLGRLRDAVVRPLVMGATEKIMVPRINDLRVSHRLSPISGADEFFRTAPLMLVATAEPFEYPHPEWEPGVKMIGAMPWEPPSETPSWLEGIEGDIVVVTTSSEYQADEELVRAAFVGLADEPITVVATMPAARVRIAVPANARLVAFTPHGPLLDRASVAITHGGMGATQKALARGVPVCVVPFGRDQHEVAARVVTADCGTRLPAGRLTAAALRDKVREAATKTAGARRVASGYAAAGGATAGAAAVERLLAGVRAGG